MKMSLKFPGNFYFAAASKPKKNQHTNKKTKKKQKKANLIDYYYYYFFNFIKNFTEIFYSSPPIPHPPHTHMHADGNKTCEAHWSSEASSAVSVISTKPHS